MSSESGDRARYRRLHFKETQVEGGIANRQDEARIVLEAEKESKPQEAWVTMITEPVAADTIKRLLFIGRLLRYCSYFHNQDISLQKRG